ncbi:FimV/HubP family polar landmark protein [Pararobbsia silviterrae]|uniref:Fimbrial protein FimV n=1 Tax=Pararobbsia silviterrae TaxID=1792498 RepID=A0A494Y7G5_9BURK|nr:FimV/HubP family polar landmark protein [Pararobbsia silviterrae]RKP57497.1 hypothetical protein D7S86_05885 [Pararobbsia silviterrae]
MWKTTALAWSIAALAASSVAAHAQGQAPASTSTHPSAAGVAPAGQLGAAPQAASAAALPEHYAVQKGQSLLDVAAALTLSDDKTVKQNMAKALFDANPNAFYANNPSRMKAGAVLAVPRPGASADASASASAAAAASGATQAHAAVGASQGAATASAPSSSPTGTSTATASKSAPATATSLSAASASTAAAVLSASNAPAASATLAASNGSAATGAPASTAGSASASSAVATTNAASASNVTAASSEAAAAAPAASSISSASQTSVANPAASASAAATDTGAAASGAQTGAPANAASASHAWTGSIQPAPVSAPLATAVPASGAARADAPAQNVSSLQQLLQLKNRVLAAMQAHGLGAAASAPRAGGTSSASASGAAGSVGSATPQAGLRGPLALPAALAVLIVVLLGIWVCLPARRRKSPHLGDDALSSADTGVSGDPADDASRDADTVEPSGSRTADTAKSRLTSGRASRDIPRGQPPEDDSIFDAAAAHEAPAQPPYEFGAAGSMSPQDPQRGAFAETRTPFDTGLLLGLLEMHAHRREIDRFQETAHELWELTDGEGADWARAAELGRRIDPDNPLYANDPFAAYRTQHGASEAGLVKPMPDVDLNLPVDDAAAPDASRGETAGDQPARPSAAPESPSAPRGPVDLSWLDAPSAGAREAFQPHTPAGSPPARDNAALPEARQPEHVPVADPRLATSLGEPDAGPAPVGESLTRGTAGAGAVAGLGAPSGASSVTPAGTEQTDAAPPDARRHDDAGEPPALDGDAAQASGASDASDTSADAPGANAPEATESPDRARDASRPLFSGDAVRTSALRDAQRGNLLRDEPPPLPPPLSPGLGAAGFGALNLDFDLELTPNAAAPGSTPTSHDLATIALNKLDLAAEYVELGDRAGARTLLNEVLATHDLATRERAQALLDSLK